MAAARSTLLLLLLAVALIVSATPGAQAKKPAPVSKRPPSPAPPPSDQWVFRCSARAAPGVSSKARAGLWLSYAPRIGNGTFLGMLILEKITDFWGAHIHYNTTQYPKTIALWVLPSDKSGPLKQPISGTFTVKYSVDASQLAAGDGVYLLQQLLSGKAYLNVHTLQYPAGELQAVPELYASPAPL